MEFQSEYNDNLKEIMNIIISELYFLRRITLPYIIDQYLKEFLKIYFAFIISIVLL